MRAEDEHAEGERESDQGEDDHPERRDAPPNKAAPLLTVVGDVEGPHQVLHRTGQRPEGQHAADAQHRDARPLVLGHRLQAAVEQARRLCRHDPVQFPDHGRDGMRSGE